MLKQDWHYASILGLNRGVNHFNHNRFRKAAMISRIRRVSSYAIRAVQMYGNNASESTHENSLLSSTMTMGSSSHKPSRCLEKVTWTDPTNHHPDYPFGKGQVIKATEKMKISSDDRCHEFRVGRRPPRWTPRGRISQRIWFSEIRPDSVRLPIGLPKSDQCQISLAASPEKLQHTVWRTWLFIAYSDERWLLLPILTTSLIHFKRLGECTFWKNVHVGQQKTKVCK